MMDHEKLVRRLMETFLDELQDHVTSMNRHLLALEADPPATACAEHYRELFRSAHSLKGAARAVNVDVIADVCHRLEDLLGTVREGALQMTPPMFALLYRCVDGIADAAQRLRDAREPAGGKLPSLIPLLALAAAGDLPAELPPERPPSDPDPSPRAAAVRVPAEKLDALLARSGELLVARRRVQRRVEELEDVLQHLEVGKAAPTADPRRHGASPLLAEIEDHLTRLALRMESDRQLLDQACESLDAEVRRVRLLPFAEACSGLDRAVRDLATATGKEVQLVVEGEGVEIDRSVLEGLKDPLLHLVRNAVDHGLETPDERRAANKRLPGTITVSASLQGTHVAVIVADDGSGFDLSRIRSHARRQGIRIPDTDESVAQLVFRPGFSTSSQVTDISGRGVGLDVVQHQIEHLQGTIELDFKAGEGTRFVLNLPLTLTTTRAVMARAGTQMFAIPTANVEKIVRVAPDAVKTTGGRHVLALGGPPIVVARLQETLGMPASETAETATLLAVVVATGTQRAAVIVDELPGEQEVTIKHLGSRLRRVKNLSGATLLESGEVALVLNAADLVRTLLGAQSASQPLVRTPMESQVPGKRILVVDDSLTTRTLLQAILEGADHEVDTAADGRFALEMLETQSFDVVVTDLDMPRLDGFGLTAAIRKSPRLRELPVILVTSRSSDEDRRRGIEVGADAYLVKSGFDQAELLETIQQL